ncbi:MAG: hypothetical protein FWE20_13085, partial [Defluviitaleaceae bacterium]|nr:hypothetical protein [Defluviitaleaceae bacterium]
MLTTCHFLMYLNTAIHEADRLGRMAWNWWPNVVGIAGRMSPELVAGYSGIAGRMSPELVAECSGIRSFTQHMVKYLAYVFHLVSYACVDRIVDYERRYLVS